MSKFKFIACCALVVLEKGAWRERNGPSVRTHCWELSWVALDQIGLKVKWKSMALRLTGGGSSMAGKGVSDRWKMEIL